MPGPFIDPDTLPDRYIMGTDGVCMEPDIPNGAKIICAKDEKINAGDLVVFYFRPGRIPPSEHQAQCKRLVHGIPSFVKLPWRDHPQSDVSPVIVAAMSNPAQRIVYRCSDLLGVHKCLGLVPADAVYDAETKTYRLPSPTTNTEEKRRA